MRRNLAFLLCTCIIINSVWAGGAGETKTGESSFSIVDYYDRKVIFDAPAFSVVSLAPGITETVFALGYGDRLVGCTEFCDYPPEAAEVRRVGNLVYPDVETIMSLQPDVVIASRHFPSDMLKRLESLSLTVVVLMGDDSFEGTYNGVIRPTAQILGDVPAGERLILQMEDIKQKAVERVAGFLRSPSMYYVVGFGEGGDWTAGGETFINEMMLMAGGQNIASAVKGWAYSLEALIETDPEIIIVPDWMIEPFSSTTHYKDLTAVKEGRIFPVNEDIITREGPRLAEAFAQLVDIVAVVQ